jgi:GAF domain-containing protein
MTIGYSRDVTDLPPLDPAIVPQTRVQPRIDLILALQKVAEELFAATNPKRVNVRVATTENPHFPVLGEALAEGTVSLTGGVFPGTGYQGGDIHRQATVTLLRDTGQTIVQRDTTVDPPVVPHARKFAGQAGQMLIPLHHEGAFCGFIAVHGGAEIRDWSPQDIAALERARDRAEAELDQVPWYEVPWPFEI